MNESHFQYEWLHLSSWLELFELAPLMISLLGGALVGWVYFAGLWFTVRALLKSRQPAWIILASGLLRCALVAAAFASVAHFAGWPYLPVALAGFVFMRSQVIARNLTGEMSA